MDNVVASMRFVEVELLTIVRCVISLAPVDAPPHGVQGAAHPIAGPPDTPTAIVLPPFTQSTTVPPMIGKTNKRQRS